eukprot:scaffold91504_cov65-Phaeocystis_antarctica.AAC.1
MRPRRRDLSGAAGRQLAQLRVKDGDARARHRPADQLRVPQRRVHGRVAPRVAPRAARRHR